MRTQFDEKLEQYFQDTIFLGTMVEEYLLSCIDAFYQGDVLKAKKLVKQDKKIDEMQLKLEQDSIMLLLLQAPVAKDLRKIVTSIKIFANLERIGDYACHLAKLAVKGDREIYKDFIEPISTMAKSGAMMIRNSITAYIEDNEPLALETAKKDAEIDRFKKNIISHLLLQNPQNEVEMKQLYRYISICKDLERLGDHITTICEWVVFTVRGEMVDLGKMKEK